MAKVHVEATVNGDAVEFLEASVARDEECLKASGG